MMFMQGLTYTEAARGSLGVRLLYPNETFAKSGPGILADARRSLALAAVLNSRVSSFILRTIARGFMFSLGNLAKTPIPPSLEEFTGSAEIASAYKTWLLQSVPVERSFDVERLLGSKSVRELLLEEVAICSVLHAIEGEIEHLVCNAHGLDSVDVRAMCNEMGLPVGCAVLSAATIRSQARQSRVLPVQ